MSGRSPSPLVPTSPAAHPAPALGRARGLLLGIGLLAACNPPSSPAYIDQDGDQWTSDVDCDDKNPEVHPYADEYCDGVDNDCDGVSDEEHALDKTLWYADADADGFGSPVYTWALCDQPPGYVENNLDCDDLSGDNRPGAPEICDEIDNDCDGEIDEPGAINPQTWYADADADGFGDPAVRTDGCLPPEGYVGNFDDCDDTNPQINPDAVEVCDPLDEDEDCDGLADDLDLNPSGLITFYVDADADTHGAEGTSDVVLACEQPEGYALEADDCDDANKLTNPSAREVCGDGIDNDCNDLIDGADGAGRDVDFWVDADGDTYGDPLNYWGKACDNPGGLSTLDTDCDDADASVNPGVAEVWYDGVDADCAGDDDDDADADGHRAAAEGGDDCDDGDPLVNPSVNEVCGDGVDNDCDGVSDACEISATWTGEAGGDLIGAAIAHAGDVNGDGLADLIIGADREDAGGAGAGAAYLLLAPFSGGGDIGAEAEAKLIGEDLGDHAGIAVAGPGDVDGDGIDDLLIGAYDADGGGAGAGAAYLISGPVSGEVDLSEAVSRLDGEAPGDQAGYAVAGAGDVDADGFADLLVGAFENDDNGMAAGAVYLFEGPVTGNYRLWAADARFVGELPGDQAGWALSGAGDVDGDGQDDLLIGAPYEHTDGRYTGSAYLVLGAPRGTFELSEADAKLKGVNAGDLAGYAVSGGGDVNGDGYGDLLIGAPEADGGGSSSGAAYLVLGPVLGEVVLSAASLTLIGEDNDDQAGTAVSVAPDFDGDGLHDLIVGARLDDDDSTDAGAAYLLRAPGAGVLDLSRVSGKVLGDQREAWAGASVVGLPDTDGDGIGDIAFGAPFWDLDGDNLDAGAVYLMLGGGWP